MKAPWGKIALAGIALAGAVTFAATQVSFLQGSAPSDASHGEQAPEFTGIARWLNGEPRTMASLRGKVVWIDFWTYSCINCIRTLPAVRAMYARYHSFGLEVIGVHSPEFTFEKSAPNVRSAIARNQIPYPVAMDSDMATWRAYRNQYWPRVYLVDARGRIRFDQAGEGGEDELQDHVRALLAESGARLPDPVDFDLETPSAHITPEIYAGYLRGDRYLGNADGFAHDATTTYAEPDKRALGLAGTAGTFFLGGAWTAREEYVEAATDGARIILPFSARSVFMVASGKAATASLALDGKGVPLRARGIDARDGSVRVDREDLFRLLGFERTETHVLTITASRGFRLYTFTFG